METICEPLLTLDYILVLTVPMRNGNVGGNTFFIKEMTVLTVPMRNGNIALVVILTCFVVRSYRTYEEWKLLHFTARTDHDGSSYRTYEEWKPGQILGMNSVVSVLTVPMRNGNEMEGTS